MQTCAKKLVFSSLIGILAFACTHSVAKADLCEEKLLNNMDVEQNYFEEPSLDGYLKKCLDPLREGGWFKGEIKEVSIEQYNAAQNEYRSEYSSHVLLPMPKTKLYFSKNGTLTKAVTEEKDSADKKTVVVFEKDKRTETSDGNNTPSEDKIIRDAKGRPVKLEFIQKNKPESNRTYLYDDKNHTTTTVTPTWQLVTSCNPETNVVSIYHIDKDPKGNSFYSREETKYNASGQILWIKQNDRGKSPDSEYTWEKYYSYDNGLVTREESFNVKGGNKKSLRTANFEYNKQKQLVKISIIDGAIFYETVYIYDAKGNITSIVTANFEHSLPKIYALNFTMDEHGNWVRCELFLDNDSAVVVRKLKYW